MLPDPLHPAVVHFPIVLAVLLPLSALVGLIAVRRGAAPLLAWGVTVALAAALAGSAWLATETGEDQEERVERVVGERAIDAHSDAAKAFTLTSVVLLAVAAVGLARGRVGRVARAATLVGTVAVLGIGYNVGRLGGELVYRHGAAAAYVPGGQQGTAAGEVDD